MSTEEPEIRSPSGPGGEANSGLCSQHPHSPSVGTCEDCGREVCLTCAVPFRGRVLGTECAAKILGQEPPPLQVEDRRGRPPRLLTGIGFAIATLATLVPWKKFGEGSGLFGAWGLSPRWSMLAAAAAILGLAIWATVAVGRARPGSKWMFALRLMAVLVIAGSVLHLVRPPPFGPSSFGPWVAIAGGLAALLGAGSPSTARQESDTGSPLP